MSPLKTIDLEIDNPFEAGYTSSWRKEKELSSRGSHDGDLFPYDQQVLDRVL